MLLGKSDEIASMRDFQCEGKNHVIWRNNALPALLEEKRELMRMVRGRQLKLSFM